MPDPLPRPRKRLGQHFLIDHNIVRKMLDVAALRRDETVLEIGPGRGALTRALCERAGRVIAIEVDAALHRHLTGVLDDRRNLELHLGDAMRFAYDALPPNTVVVASLPYYLSTPLLFTLLDARRRLSRVVAMVQTEVARRIVANPGSSAYGVLSVLFQCWMDPTLAFRVAPTCFRPRPDVESAVIVMRIRAEPAVSLADDRLFVRTVRAAFAHRRKTLGNSLRDEGFPADDVTRALGDVGIASPRRAETLSLHEFAALAEALARPRSRPANPQVF